jgi:hypothetical protein
MNANQSVQTSFAAYLGEVATHLFGPRRHRERILAELRDGLDQSVADRRASGLSEDQAVMAAIDEFGRPRTVADAFAVELAVADARRTLAWFIATGPLVGVWWLLLLDVRPWHTGAVALLVALPVVPLIVVALATAGGAFAGTGRLMRWLPEMGARRAVGASITVAALAIAGDVLVLAVYGRSALGVWPLGTVAVTASLVRVVCSAVVARRAITLLGRVADVRR